MKILGLDSSGLVAGVAVAEDGVLLAEYNVNYKKTHSQTLLPMLEEIRNMLELDLDSIDAVAVASGPGSFTGLRIGSATAKGLGLALDKPLVEVPTLEGLAYNLCGVSDWVCPLIDARRNQVYTGVYEFVSAEGGERRPQAAESGPGEREPQLKIVEPQSAVDISDIIGKINRLGAGQPGRGVIFLGDGVPVYRDILTRQVKVPFSFAPAGCNRQRAGSVAALGAVYFLRGQTVSAGEHRPEYLRQSQAERERAERTHSGGENPAERIPGRGQAAEGETVRQRQTEGRV